MNYKEKIIEMVESIEDENLLKKIYDFIVAWLEQQK